MSDPGAYVYLVLVDGKVRYVGKGRAARTDVHLQMVRQIARRRAAGEVFHANKFYNRLTAAWLRGEEITFEVIASGLADDEAFEIEIAEIAARKGLWNTDAGGKGMSPARGRALWEDPEVCRKREESHAKQRDVMSEGSRAYWTPEQRKQRSEDRKGKPRPSHTKTLHSLWERPEYREKMSKMSLSQWKNPERRTKMAESARKLWEDPEYRAKMAARPKGGRPLKKTAV